MTPVPDEIAAEDGDERYEKRQTIASHAPAGTSWRPCAGAKSWNHTTKKARSGPIVRASNRWMTRLVPISGLARKRVRDGASPLHRKRQGDECDRGKDRTIIASRTADAAASDRERNVSIDGSRGLRTCPPRCAREIADSLKRCRRRRDPRRLGLPDEVVQERGVNAPQPGFFPCSLPATSLGSSRSWRPSAAGDGLPLGCRADVRFDHPLHDRGNLRGRRRHRAP